MSHYEERLERDLESIRVRVRAVADQVYTALDQAIRSLLALDKALASRTILGDLAINREVRLVDRECHAFVARHLPSAGHLRFVSSVLRLMVAFERVGDYAVTICREAVQLSAPPPEAVERDIEMMADQSRRLLRQAARSFDEQSADLARGTMGMADQFASTFDKIFGDLIREGEKGSRPVRDLFELLVVFNRLERVSDQAKNVCEETIFAVEGEMKGAKVYRVLFVDEGNDRLSPMAEAIARKAFPKSGIYSSAGWEPAEALSSGVAEFMEERGCPLDPDRPAPLTNVHDDLTAFHVIVSLGAGGWDHFPRIPFHTVFLEWPAPEGEETLEASYKRLAHEIRDLIETLRGEDAG